MAENSSRQLDRTTLFLPENLNRRLDAFYLVEHKKKRDIIAEALVEYLDKRKFALDGTVTIILPPL